MQSIQTYVAEVGLGYNHTAPYWMGEFGCGGDSDNWEKILRFLTESDHDWAYWSIDGYKYPDQGETIHNNTRLANERTVNKITRNYHNYHISSTALRNI